jgi:hypothetical protein
MDIKLFRFVLLLVFFAGTVSAQVEEQRKYQVSNADSMLAFVTSSGTLNGLFTHFHSEDVYYDLYLDTPDFSIAENHLSLRFRKRDFGTGDATYSFQLKSEMENAGGLRMEVEETELNFYKVKTEKGSTPLPAVLDVFFLQLKRGGPNTHSPEIELATKELQEWIQNNAPGPITPFQKLLHLNLKGLGPEELKTLHPVLYGSSKRFRSHIYIDGAAPPETLKNIPQNNSSTVPPFFLTDGGYNWLLESSLDFSTFYPLIETKIPKVVICEYEVENKYFMRETGTQVMDMYEKGLKEKFGATNGIDSKYLQSLKQFRGK